jgi:adenylate cyclase
VKVDPGTVVFTDLVGFTTFTATEGDAAALQLLSIQDKLVHATLPDDARVVKELGDGLLLWFPDAELAMQSCLDLLAAFDAAAESEELPLWVRVGAHWGNPARRGDDIVGHDVNVAARIVDVAAPGELLCSGAVADAAGSCDGLEFVELGPVVMKGLNEPVSLFRVEPAKVAPSGSNEPLART